MNPRTLSRSLRRKGFTQRSGHHTFFHYKTVDGQSTSIFTKLSHGAREQLSDGLVADIARQLRLSKRDLEALVSCSLSQEDYERQLRAGGHIVEQ